MSLLRTSLAVVSLCVVVSCESYELVNEPLPHVDAGALGGSDTPPPASGGGGGGSGTTPRRDSGTMPAPRGDAGTTTPGDDGEMPAEQMPGEEMPGEEMPGEMPGEMPVEPMESKIAGSGLAANCLSYALPKDGMCAGFYCGITVEDVAAEFVPAKSKCATTPERICDGQLTRTVGKCAREVKGNPLNALDTQEMIRAKVQTCVYADKANSDLAEDCVGCFLDAAQCASDNCLTQCLTSDNPTCDKCRLDKKCNQPVPSCAGFPSPF